MMILASRDEQLGRTLSALRNARGAVVTLDDLRRDGVLHPAMAVYELEAAGVEIDRVRAPGRRRCSLAGYRLARG